MLTLGITLDIISNHILKSENEIQISVLFENFYSGVWVWKIVGWGRGEDLRFSETKNKYNGRIVPEKFILTCNVIFICSWLALDNSKKFMCMFVNLTEVNYYWKRNISFLTF